MKVVLGPITMDVGAPDGSGHVWLCTALQGWDSPDLRRATQDYAVKDGVAVPRASYGSRALVLDGVCKPSEYWSAYNLLLEATGNPNVPVALTVTEDVDKTLQVYRVGPPKQDIKVGHFVFSVPLVAPDPIKHGAQTTVEIASGANGVLDNTGNYPSDAVVVTVTGGAGTVNLNNTAQDRRLTTGSANDVANGTVFDLRRRTVYSASGQNRYSELSTTSVWWSLEPGTNTVENDGTADVSITFRPAWV